MLDHLTTPQCVGIVSNMKAAPLVRARIVFSPDAFAEIVLWRVPRPVPGSAHAYKYRLAYVVREECVVRYDNEAGKGDHRHFAGEEAPYELTTPERLIADFQRDISRWNDEYRDSRRPSA